MTNRRQLLKIGLAASTLSLANRAALGAQVARQDDVVPLYKVLSDVRFPASVAFARRAAAHGVPVHAMDGDMTRFWYDDLYHRWRRGPAAIAGLTAHGALFCLEQLAWDQRMRVVFRAEHAAAPGGVIHTIEAPPMAARAAARAADELGWADAMADVVLHCPAERAAMTTTRAATIGRALPPGTAEPLFSWLIARV